MEEFAELEAPVRKVLVEELGSVLRSLATRAPMDLDSLRWLQARTCAAFEFARKVDRARKDLALGGES